VTPRALVVVLMLVACDHAPPATTTSAVPMTSASVAAPAKRCLPVVAAQCGCVYSCGTGTQTSANKWSVVHPFWAPHPLEAKIAPWCVSGDCTDAFHAELP